MHMHTKCKGREGVLPLWQCACYLMTILRTLCRRRFAQVPVLKVLRKKKDLKAMLAHREQNDKPSAVSRVQKFREKLRIISKK